MATCRDCVCVNVCELKRKHTCSGTRIYDHENIEKLCLNFKDRSRFVELSYAEWVEDEDMYGDPIYHCSNCNEHFVLEEGTPIENHYFYCPNCGAKMDEQALREREENA